MESDKNKLSDIDELNKRVSNLEKENMELKKMFKDVLTLFLTF